PHRAGSGTGSARPLGRYPTGSSRGGATPRSTLRALPARFRAGRAFANERCGGTVARQSLRFRELQRFPHGRREFLVAGGSVEGEGLRVLLSREHHDVGSAVFAGDALGVLDGPRRDAEPTRLRFYEEVGQLRVG